MKLKIKSVFSSLIFGFVGGSVALGLYFLIGVKADNNSAFQYNPLPVHYANYNGNPGTGPDFRDAAMKSVHAVVHIKTQYKQKNRYYDEFFGMNPFFDFFRSNPYNQYPIVASGSGVIISEDGYIVTNNHVVQNADYIEVTLNDKRGYQAQVVGTDPETDIALIKIEESNLPFLVFANSDELQIGEWVLAVGNPFNLTSTVTAGIVSAKAREINILGESASIESFIQTDAAVNPGNSGGALVNVNGDLVGINAAIASNTGSYAGYSFAIPSKLVYKIVNDIMEFGEVQRAYLGIAFSDIDSKFAKEKNLQDVSGVYVQSVIENGSAAKAGLISGDVIVKINEHAVNSKSELMEYIARQRPGDIIQLTYRRKSKYETTEVELQNKKGTTSIVKTDPAEVISYLGAEFGECSSEELYALNITHGVKVEKLKNGPLQNAGIKEGFIIVYINQKTVATVEDISDILTGTSGSVLIEGMYPNGMRAYYGFGL